MIVRLRDSIGSSFGLQTTALRCTPEFVLDQHRWYIPISGFETGIGKMMWKICRIKDEYPPVPVRLRRRHNQVLA